MVRIAYGFTGKFYDHHRAYTNYLFTSIIGYVFMKIFLLLLVFLGLCFSTLSVQAQVPCPPFTCEPGSTPVQCQIITIAPKCILVVSYCVKVNNGILEVVMKHARLESSDPQDPNACNGLSVTQAIDQNIKDIFLRAAAERNFNIPGCPTAAFARFSLGGCRTADITYNRLTYTPGQIIVTQVTASFACETTFRCWQNYALCNNQAIGDGLQAVKVGDPYTEGTACVGATFTYNRNNPELPFAPGPFDDPNDWITVPCIPNSCP
jgi:hypothetical protein